MEKQIENSKSRLMSLKNDSGLSQAKSYVKYALTINTYRLTFTDRWINCTITVTVFITARTVRGVTIIASPT